MDFLGFNSRGSYLRYKYDSGLIFLWHLKINGEEVSKKGGHVFGFYGFIQSGMVSLPPGEYPCFKLWGSGILILHGLKKS